MSLNKKAAAIVAMKTIALFALFIGIVILGGVVGLTLILYTLSLAYIAVFISDAYHNACLRQKWSDGWEQRANQVIEELEK